MSPGGGLARSPRATCPHLEEPHLLLPLTPHSTGPTTFPDPQTEAAETRARRRALAQHGVSPCQALLIGSAPGPTLGLWQVQGTLSPRPLLTAGPMTWLPLCCSGRAFADFCLVIFYLRNIVPRLSAGDNPGLTPAQGDNWGGGVQWQGQHAQHCQKVVRLVLLQMGLCPFLWGKSGNLCCL